MERYNGAGVVMAVLLVLATLAALAEVVSGRAAVMSEPARVSTWPSFVQAGDEARLRDDVPAARGAYLAALFRARGERSVIGVLRAAEGFKALGDREVVEQALGMAAALGPDDGGPDARRARLQALRDRLDATDALPIGVHSR